MGENIWSEKKLKGDIIARSIHSKNSKEISWLKTYSQKKLKWDVLARNI